MRLCCQSSWQENQVFSHRYALVMYASTLKLLSAIMTVLMNQAAQASFIRHFDSLS